MKDIEKIKSEDLGCQVQDANPGNFAIEQEVAQLVGATVPAPTAPSADDARELGAQLLVFLRRALTPIQTALRTAVADIYSHLDSRCTDYTPAAYASYIPRPYDPMGLTPRTLPNLLQAITAFASRKISNGSATADGIPDGISLAHLLCSANQVTELVDDNYGYELNNARIAACLAAFPNLKKLTCNGTGRLADGALNGNTSLEVLHLPKATSIYRYDSRNAAIMNCSALKEVIMESCTEAYGVSSNYPCIYNCANLQRVVFGKVTSFLSVFRGTMPNIIDVEFADGVAVDINFESNYGATWNPTNALSSSASDLVADPTAHPTWKNLDQFLQNFLEHICQRLANRTGQTKLTLTLSAAVYTAIMTDNDIKAELVARNWKVTDGTNNYNN